MTSSSGLASGSAPSAPSSPVSAKGAWPSTSSSSISGSSAPSSASSSSSSGSLSSGARSTSSASSSCSIPSGSSGESEEAGVSKELAETGEPDPTRCGAARSSGESGRSADWPEEASSALKRSSRLSGPSAGCSEGAVAPVLLLIGDVPVSGPGGDPLRSVGEAGPPPLLPHRTHHTRPAPRASLGTAAADGLHAQTHGLRPVCGAGPGHGPERGSQCGSLLPTGYGRRRGAARPAARRRTRSHVTLASAAQPGRDRPSGTAPGLRRRPPPGRARTAGDGRGRGVPPPIRSDGPGRPAGGGTPGPRGSLQWILMVRVAASRPFFERKAVPPWV